MERGKAAAAAAADAIAERLASPGQVRALNLRPGWWPQSLANGAAGIALVHIARARAGLAPWRIAHDWLECAAGGQALSGPDSHLFYGAPALAFALHTAADQTGHYARALDTLDRHVAAATRRRLAAAHARIDQGRLPALAEFDAIRGLTGLGAYLLRRDPGGDLIRDVVAYLIRLTEPIDDDGDLLPGWWSDLSPAGHRSAEFPGGHANTGMAHGIGGPLALLALATRSGIVVDGHAEAIGRILAWLDRWRHTGDPGPWWPYWVTRAHLRAEPLDVPARGPSRPSWCYGTAGIARAQQLAALALGDPARHRMAEDALAALTDPGQLAATTDLSLCHGYAGLAHIAAHAARDALTPVPAACLPPLLANLVPPDADPRSLAARLLPPGTDAGLLEGAAGIALALHTASTDTPPVGWDAFMLIA